MQHTGTPAIHGGEHVSQRLDAVEGAAMGALIPPATLLNIAMPLKLPVRTP